MSRHLVHRVGVEGEPAVVTEPVRRLQHPDDVLQGHRAIGVPCAQQCLQTLGQPAASMHRYSIVTATRPSQRCAAAPPREPGQAGGADA